MPLRSCVEIHLHFTVDVNKLQENVIICFAMLEADCELTYWLQKPIDE